MLFRREEVNLEKRGDYMLLYYQRSRFRFKCSCSIPFLRNVEPQGSAEYNATACFVRKKIVIERTRDLNYLKFVATDFSPKTISLSAGENSGDLA